MWEEWLGEFTVGPGTFVVVPRGRRHRTFDVREDLLVYDVFYPPMF
jgi:mannose-6-phosphate isomerase-like protein (cupin superfamily)